MSDMIRTAERPFERKEKIIISSVYKSTYTEFLTSIKSF